MINQEIIKTMGCGIRNANVVALLQYEPRLLPILKTFPDMLNINSYKFDMKVHMLMPNQWPCIPNWHRDLVPRDKNNNLLEDKITPQYPLYLWVSNEPFTVFKEGGEIKPRTWVKFTQNDYHRGEASTKHIWRLFLRASHEHINNNKMYIPRHTQVYLDSKNFTW